MPTELEVTEMPHELLDGLCDVLYALVDLNRQLLSLSDRKSRLLAAMDLDGKIKAGFLVSSKNHCAFCL